LNNGANKYVFSNLVVISTTVLGAGLLSCSNFRPRAATVQQNATGQREKRRVPQSIGTATMSHDGTIILNLRAEGPGGIIGEAHLVYPPKDAQYVEILKHLGGLRPGESKKVSPWP
jgi:hypothetical protein